MTPTHAGTDTDFQPTGYSGQTNPLPMLKPCPFCGQELHRYEEDGEWVIECLTKGCLMICGPLCKKDAMERMLDVRE